MLDTEKVRKLREQKKLTQEAAAKRAGLKSRQHWNKIETGRSGSITLDTLEAVATALGVKPKELLK